jgi:hypothetical protein
MGGEEEGRPSPPPAVRRQGRGSLMRIEREMVRGCATSPGRWGDRGAGVGPRRAVWRQERGSMTLSGRWGGRSEGTDPSRHGWGGRPLPARRGDGEGPKDLAVAVDSQVSGGR